MVAIIFIEDTNVTRSGLMKGPQIKDTTNKTGSEIQNYSIKSHNVAVTG